MISSTQMKKIITLVCGLSSLFSFHSSHAQAADATISFNGQVTANTCVLNLSDTVNTTKTVGGTRSVSLANATSTSTTAGTAFGTANTITLGVQVSTSDTNNCTISGGGSKWNAVFDLAAGTVDSSISNKPYLKNTVATGAATGVGIALFDGSGTQYTSLLTGQGVNGTKVSSTGAAGTGTLSFKAQLMTTTTSAPGVGTVGATLPLTLVYN